MIGTSPKRKPVASDVRGQMQSSAGVVLAVRKARFDDVAEDMHVAQ
jgi:hypothetical protein